jgi:hypothetical protein
LFSKLYEKGTEIVWGRAGVENEPYWKICIALHERNIRLVKASQGLVVFINGKSKGSIFTLKKDVKEKIPVVVFTFNSKLPNFQGVAWLPLTNNSLEGALSRGIWVEYIYITYAICEVLRSAKADLV